MNGIRKNLLRSVVCPVRSGHWVENKYKGFSREELAEVMAKLAAQSRRMESNRARLERLKPVEK